MVAETLVVGINTEQRNKSETAKRKIEKLTRLTTNFLDIAKIKLGMMELRREKVEIGLLIDEIEADNSMEISRKNLTIKKNIQADIGPLWADRDKITEVIIDLMGNAIKYTTPGGNIAIKLLGNDSEIRFEISDTDASITEENIDKLHNIFQHISFEKQEGAGLGLFVAKDIIELHNGRIWVESQIGKGSRFIFVLPRDFQNP